MSQPTGPYFLDSVDLACHLKQVKQTFSDLENTLNLHDSNDFKNHTNQKEYFIYLFNKLVECEYLNLRLCRLHQYKCLPQKKETYFQTSTLKSTIQVRETTTAFYNESLSTDFLKTEWTPESVSYENDIENSLNQSPENSNDIQVFDKEFQNLRRRLKCFREQLGKHINLLEKNSILTLFELEKLLHRVRRMHLINIEWIVQLNLKHLSKYDNLILFMKYVMELTHTSTPEECINALSKLFKPSVFKQFNLFQSKTTAVCPSLKMTHKWTKVTTLANISQASTKSFPNTDIILPLTDSKAKASKFVGTQNVLETPTQSNNTNVYKIKMKPLSVPDNKTNFSQLSIRAKTDEFRAVDETILPMKNPSATESALSCAKFHQLTYTEMLSIEANDSVSLSLDTKTSLPCATDSRTTPFHKVSKNSLITTDCGDVVNKHVHEDISLKVSEECLKGTCVKLQKHDTLKGSNHKKNAKGNETLHNFNDDICKSSVVTSLSIAATNNSTSAFVTTSKETHLLWTHNLKNLDSEEQAIFKDLLKSQTLWEKELSFNKKDNVFHSNWMRTALLKNFTNNETDSPKFQTTLVKSLNENDAFIYSKQLNTISQNDVSVRSNFTTNPADTHSNPTINLAETLLQPTTNLADTRSNPTINLAETHSNPTINLAETLLQPTTNLADTRSNPTINLADTHSNPTINLAETLLQPTTNLADTRSNPTINLADTHSNPTINLAETLLQPTTNLADTRSNSTINLADTHSNPTINLAETLLQPTTNLADTRLNPTINLADTHSNPTINLAETLLQPTPNPADTRSNPTINLADAILKSMKDSQGARLTPIKKHSNQRWKKKKNVQTNLGNTADHHASRSNYSLITNKQYRKHNHYACQKTIHNYRLMYRALIHETHDECINANMKLFSLWIGLSIKEECGHLPSPACSWRKPVTCDILEAYVTNNLLFAQPLPSTTPSCGILKIFDSFFCTGNKLSSKKYKLETN